MPHFGRIQHHKGHVEWCSFRFFSSCVGSHTLAIICLFGLSTGNLASLVGTLFQFRVGQESGPAGRVANDNAPFLCRLDV